MWLTDLMILAAGLAVLIVGAELLVRGSSRLAMDIGLTPLVIGVTLVAFGTSAPELAVSVVSAAEGETGITLGNIIGGNIFNVLIVLGLSALIAPLRIAPRILRIEVPLMIGVTVLFAGLAWNGLIGWFDGIILIGMLGVFLVFSFRQSKGQESGGDANVSAQPASSDRGKPSRYLTNGMFVVLGFAGLAFGAEWVTRSTVVLAQTMGVSEMVAGIVIVGGATSLPEAMTSVIATLKGQRELAIGNIIGSNVFNICGALGVASLVAPAGIPVPPSAIWFDIPILLAVALATLPILFTGRIVSRWEGALFVAYFLAYVAYLVMEANRHEALPAFSDAMLLFVIPLTALALTVSVVRALLLQRNTKRHRDRVTEAY